MGHDCKNVSHLEKWATVNKIGETYENATQIEKCVTLTRIGDS